MGSGPAGAPRRSPRWPWALFVLAAAWSILIRVPLVLNAANHLDSDLAVDGLTLLDATSGHWRWHYPGTPFIGTGPVLLSFPQALIWGATPQSLVSGGVIAWQGLMLMTFLLAWQAFGPRVAAWSLVPLTFASTGGVWLSGRITGGHLVAAVWHAGAFALLAYWHRRGRALKTALVLGLWCGLGLALDSMFALTVVGVAVARVCLWFESHDPRRGLARRRGRVASRFSWVSCPRYVGAWADPYDAYRDQFAPVTEPEVLASHARLLAFDCLPRLLVGHRLPGLESDPDPGAVFGPTPSRRSPPFDVVAACAVGLGVSWGLFGILALLRSLIAGPTTLERAIVTGLLISALLTFAAFVVNRNIFNSDNYRYLVCLLVPWSLGFGLGADYLCAKGRTQAIVAVLTTLVFAVVMTADLARWYARFGWIDERGRPLARPLDDPTLAWLGAHPEITWIHAGYWDVYRLSFLTGGRVRGAPFAVYPNRFPAMAAGAG